MFCEKLFYCSIFNYSCKAKTNHFFFNFQMEIAFLVFQLVELLICISLFFIFLQILKLTVGQAAYPRHAFVSFPVYLRFPWRIGKCCEWYACEGHPRVKTKSVDWLQSKCFRTHLSTSNFFHWRWWLLPNYWMPNFAFILLHLIS